MVSLKASLRHQIILDVLRRDKQASVLALSDACAVSGVTIRDDLRFLEKMGLLVRTRGGALAHNVPQLEPAFEDNRKTNVEAKMAIGRYAASLVQDGQKIILDVGSTTTALAEALPLSLRDVTVITNSLNIAILLEKHPGVSVIVTGGTLRAHQHALVSPLGTVLLERLKADIAFLGCSGVEPRHGITNSNIAEAEIKQVMVSSALKTIIVADHSKLGTVASAFVTDLSQVTAVVTDDAADPRGLQDLRVTGLDIRVAPLSLLRRE